MHATLSNASSDTTAWIAVAAGAIQLVGLVSLLVFFAVGEPFGTLNDACIALAGFLSGVLAWMLFAALPAQSPALSRLSLALAVIGALVVAAGSALVIFKVTGFVLAGFYTELGNALIGLWLLVTCFSAQNGAGWPRGLVVLGVVAGAVMLLGFFTVPAILRGLDTMAINPWYVIVGYVGWLGTFFVYPIWCLWLGRVILRHG